MEDDNLRQLLEQLHAELEHTHTVDAKGRELLRDLGMHIDELLARSEEDQAEARQDLLAQLEKSISYLEVTHPTLTNTLSDIFESLSNAGI